MRKIILITVVTVSVLSCSDNKQGDHQVHDHAAQKSSTDTTKKSIPKETLARIGNTDIKINYHSPGVRGRTIWGGLVPYNEVWVTGAHKATTLEINQDFRLCDQLVPAGKYALFTIPGKEEWMVIINKKWDQHLADDYSATDDVARIKVKPEWKEESTERLSYAIEQVGEKTAVIAIRWEKLLLPVRIEILDK